MLFRPCDDYVDELKATWRSLGESERLANVDPLGLADKETAAFAFADLFALERAVLAAEPEPLLRRHAWVVRDRFRNIAGEDECKAYVDSNPPNADSAPVDTLRSDLEILLGKTHYLLLFQPSREQMRSRLTVYAYGLILAALIAAAAAWVTSLQAHAPYQTPFLQSVGAIFLAFFMGVVGGTLSVIQRIQSLPEGDPLFRSLLIRVSSWGLIGSPITGGAFAVILYLVFAANLFQASVFPSIKTPDTTTPNFWAFITATYPKIGVDWAKVLVWSFLAGFAERLVPDLLTRLTTAAQSARTSH